MTPGKNDLSRKSPVIYVVINILFCVINRLRALKKVSRSPNDDLDTKVSGKKEEDN